MSRLVSNNLRTKLFLAILLILLVSYSILIYFTFASVKNFVSSEVDQQLLENLKLIRATIRVRTDITISSLSQPAAAQPVRQWVQERQQLLLADAIRRWREVLPFMDFMMVVDAQQHVIARLGSKAPVGEESGFAGLLAKTFRSQEPMASTELVRAELLSREGVKNEAGQQHQGRALTSVIAIPIKGKNGQLLGGIIAGDVIFADSRYLEMARGLLGQSVVAGISQNGKLVAGTVDSILDELPPEILASHDRGITFHGKAMFGNRALQAISEPLQNLQGEMIGALTVAMFPERYMGMSREYERNILLSISIGALLSFIIAYLVARRLTAPLQELATGVHRLENGDLNQQVIVAANDEFGMLADAFNRMVLSLQERDSTISRKTSAVIELNEQLEARVRERTAQLSEQARLQEEILGSMAEGVVVVDAGLRVILFNQAAREMFGMLAADLQGQDFSRICTQGAFCGLRTEIDQLIGTGGRALVSIATADKFIKANLSTVTGIDGTVAGVVISFRDVTIEEAIDRMKTEFIATVSHELKTPLTSMKGSLQYILGKGKWLTGSERELLEICQRNTDRLIRLITSILDISTIESGGIKFVLTPQIPSELVISAIEELRGLALHRNVAVINVVEADMPMILGDHDRLIQVLTNLLANAIKFSEAGKVVKVEARKVDRQLAIAIVDCNRTIPESERGKLFKKFQQIDQGSGGNLGGSGLGLAISKEIVERHNGQISYQPINSGGNEFTITIPLYEEQE